MSVGTELYLELVPRERIRHTDRFDDPNLPGEMQTTIVLRSGRRPFDLLIRGQEQHDNKVTGPAKGAHDVKDNRR